MALPASQAEWRKVSTAIRTARREMPKGRERTFCVRQISHRYLYAESYGGAVRCYNGGSAIYDVLMIGYCRRRYLEGSRTGRRDDAQGWARACQSNGPIPLP